jgi:hypothetical protein
LTRPYFWKFEGVQYLQDVVGSIGRPISEPISLIGQASESSATAALKYPGYRFSKLVLARLDTDDADISDLGALLDADLLSPVEMRPPLFDQQLRHLISNWTLGALFREDGVGTYHHVIRPRGYDFDSDAVIPVEMERWRADYRMMEPVRQMIAASIVWLYRGIDDNRWIRRIPSTWHAADAIQCLKHGSALVDWARLFALYPGW